MEDSSEGCGCGCFENGMIIQFSTCIFQPSSKVPVFKHPILVQVLPTRPSTGNYKHLITFYSLRGHPAGDICSLTLFRSGSLPTRWFRWEGGGGVRRKDWGEVCPHSIISGLLIRSTRGVPGYDAAEAFR